MDTVKLNTLNWLFEPKNGSSEFRLFCNYRTRVCVCVCVCVCVKNWSFHYLMCRS